VDHLWLSRYGIKSSKEKELIENADQANLTPVAWEIADILFKQFAITRSFGDRINDIGDRVK
jgi:hypothetical protein